MKMFKGLCPPLITPFGADGNQDYNAMAEHVNFMIEGGADALCAGSSTGEFSSLTYDEWKKQLAAVKETNSGRVPLMACGAWMSTAETIERCRIIEKLGYDGILIISPWYMVHTQREIYAHMKAVRNAVGLPIMIYNNPPVTGIQLSADLLTRLASEGVIQYLKDADSDPYKLSILKMRLGDKLKMFYGHDNNALGGLAFGAVGWFSGTSNLDPKRYSRIVDLCVNKNDFASARTIWREILPYIEMATVGENGERADWIAVIKRAMELRGRTVGTVRPPMLPLTPETDKKLQKIIAAMSFD